jgi:hypothetical protein
MDFQTRLYKRLYIEEAGPESFSGPWYEAAEPQDKSSNGNLSRSSSPPTDLFAGDERNTDLHTFKQSMPFKMNY